MLSIFQHKKNRKTKKPLISAFDSSFSLKIYFLVVTFLFIAIYISIYFFTQQFYQDQNKTLSQKEQNTKAETITFFTELYPKHFIWKDNENILFTTENELKIYNIKEKVSKKIISTHEIGEDEIIQLYKNKDYIFLQTSSSLFRISDNIKNEPEVILEKILDLDGENHIAINDELACMSQNFIINNPNDIASIITVFEQKDIQQITPEINIDEYAIGSLANSKSEIDSRYLYRFQTSLSLKPISCNKNEMILVSSSPKLLQKAYLITLSSDQKEYNDYNVNINEIIFDTNNIDPSSPTEINEFKIDITAKVLFSKSYLNDIFYYDIEMKYTDKIVENIKADFWGPFDRNSISVIENHNSYSLILRYGPNDNKNILYKIDYPEHFVKMDLSPDKKNVALISLDQELWVIENIISD